MSNSIEIGSIRPRVRYEGDGEKTDFHFSFKIFSTDDVDVYIDDNLLATDYIVNLETEGGSVTFNTAPAKGAIITIHRKLDFKRTTNFQEVGPFRTSKVNLEFDYQLACMEQLKDSIDRTVTFPPYAPTILNVSLPMPEAGKAIIWNENANSLKNSKIEIDKYADAYLEIKEHNKTVAAKTEIVISKTQDAVNAAATAMLQAENVKNRSETIYTSVKDLGPISGDITVMLDAEYFEYMVTAEDNINFTFDFSKVNNDKVITFGLLIKQSSNHTYSYNFGENTAFTWLDDISATPEGCYLLTFRKYPDGMVVGTPIGKLS